MTRVLILGHNGMLGHMVAKYLVDKCECEFIESRFPTQKFKDDIQSFGGDYIINCIGAIPQNKKEFDINYDLPVWLCKNVKCRIIHPGTDCETDNTPYGISKRKSSEHIKSGSVNTKILKSSIIGPELKSSNSLLSWFLNSKTEVRGYKNSMWSGITTLEWAKLCWAMICYWEDFDTENIVQGTCLSKFDLLHIIKDVYQKDIIIVPYENEYVDKCLNGSIITKHIREQIIEAKSFYEST